MAGAGAGGVRHWLAEEAPDFRPRMLRKLASKLAQFYQGKYAPYSHELQSLVAKFEEGAFNGANSKEDYIRNLSNKLVGMEKRRREEQQQLMLRSKMQPANAVQALQRGNSSVVPQAAGMTSPRRPSSQPMTPETAGLVPNQHMVYPYTPNMQIEVKEEQPEMMAFLDQFLNFQPTAVAPMATGVQLGLRPIQSVATPSQSQNPARQQQAANFAGCNPTSVAKLKGQPATPSNPEQNRLLNQNSSGIGMQQLQPMTMNPQSLRTNQQEMDRQRYQMLGAQQTDVSKMQTSQPRGWNNQHARQTDVLQSPLKACKPEPMTPPLQQVTCAHQSTSLCQNSQVSGKMRSVGEVDVMEKMFDEIKSWKDAHFSEFVELYQRVVIPNLTEEQFLSLPKEKADEYRCKVNIKNLIRKTLKFLQLQKSNVHEGLKVEFPKYKRVIEYLLRVAEYSKAHNAKMNTGYQSQNCLEQPQVINLTSNAAPITATKSTQQEQSADGSILQSRQTIVTRRTPAHQENNSNHLLGLASPFSVSPQGALQSLPTNKLEFLTSSPLAKSGFVPVASPCASVKSALTSPFATPALVPVASPCTSVKCTLSDDGDGISAFLLQGNGAAAPLPPPPAAPKANCSNQVTPPKPTTLSSPLQAEPVARQTEDQVCCAVEPPVVKKPIDHLIAAMRSSSPEALRGSVNSIWSVLNISDIVPHGEIGTFLDCTFSKQEGGSNNVNKMKRVFDHTTSRSESSPLGSMDGSCVTLECDASDSGSSGERNVKRQKTQNANDALLEEIIAINNTLIDTVISMTSDCGMDGITSCDEGTTIKLSYSAVSISPGLKSLFATAEMFLVMPVKLFIPKDYPKSSPVLVDDKDDDQLRKKFSFISESVHVAFRRGLIDLSEPRSIKETASVWDACVRKAMTEFAHQHGGGTISCRVGRWERCTIA